MYITVRQSVAKLRSAPMNTMPEKQPRQEGIAKRAKRAKMMVVKAVYPQQHQGLFDHVNL